MNNFAYNRQTRVLSGYYNDNLRVTVLDQLVSRVLCDDTTTIVGTIVADGLNLAMREEVSMQDGIQFFSQLLTEMQEITTQTKLTEYERRAGPWLEVINKEPDPLIKRDLLVEYINLVSKFVTTNLQYSVIDPMQSVCMNCRNIVDNDNDDHCIGCGAWLPQYIASSKYIEANDVIPKPKTTKDSYDKFKEKYLRFQGRWLNCIADADLNLIQTELATKYITTTEEYHSTNAMLLRNLLVTLKLTKYKDDVNLLMNLLWNYPLPNLSLFDDTIERNWRAGQAIMEDSKIDSDAHTIAFNDWRLYSELIDVGYDCDTSDFQIASNKNTQKRYAELWALRCTGLAKLTL